jgi:TonB family protein
LIRTQGLLRDLGQAEPPDLPWRQLEAQIHWRLARPGDEKQPWLLTRLLPLVGAAVVGAVATLLVIWLVGPGLSSPPRTAPTVTTAKVPTPTTVVLEQELAAVPTMVQGEVFLVTKKGRQPLELDQPLVQGARVATGAGRVSMQWSKESGLLLSGHSEIELQRLTSTNQSLLLHKGRVRSRLAKLCKGCSYIVKARGIQASVKGTVFDVAIGQSTVDVAVAEGRVKVAPTAGGWGVEVPAGFRVQVPFDAKAAPPLLPLGERTGPRVHVVAWPNLARMLATSSLLTLESHPSGADLFLNSTPVGSTNLALRSAPGRHLVELYRDGKLVDQRWLELGEQPGKLKVRMRGRTLVPRLPPRIHNLIRHRAVQIRSCYERHLKRDPKLQGRLTFRFNIDADGEVDNIRLLGDTFKDPRVGQCAQIVIQRWRFPPGRAVQVVYPFIFRPQ